MIPTRLLVSGALLAASALTAAPAARPLFDGRTLDGWEGEARSWRVEDGALTGTIAAGERLARNEFLYWRGEVADFELSVEFRISGDASANSGIQFRSRRQPDGHAAGYQADLDLGRTWLGRLYEEHGRQLLVERGDRVSIAPDGRRWSEKFGEPADFASLLRPAPAWNAYRIVARGPHVELWVNGKRVSVLDDHQTGAAAHRGLLAFQLHSGPGPVKVQFRNVLLTDLGATELPPARAAAKTTAKAPAIDPNIGAVRKNGDPPLRRVAGVDDLTRLHEIGRAHV